MQIPHQVAAESPSEHQDPGLVQHTNLADSTLQSATAHSHPALENVSTVSDNKLLQLSDHRPEHAQVLDPKQDARPSFSNLSTPAVLLALPSSSADASGSSGPLQQQQQHDQVLFHPPVPASASEASFGEHENDDDFCLIDTSEAEPQSEFSHSSRSSVRGDHDQHLDQDHYGDQQSSMGSVDLVFPSLHLGHSMTVPFASSVQQVPLPDSERSSFDQGPSSLSFERSFPFSSISPPSVSTLNRPLPLSVPFSSVARAESDLGSHRGHDGDDEGDDDAETDAQVDDRPCKNDGNQGAPMPRSSSNPHLSTEKARSVLEWSMESSSSSFDSLAEAQAHVTGTSGQPSLANQPASSHATTASPIAADANVDNMPEDKTGSITKVENEMDHAFKVPVAQPASVARNQSSLSDAQSPQPTQSFASSAAVTPPPLMLPLERSQSKDKAKYSPQSPQAISPAVISGTTTTTNTLPASMPRQSPGSVRRRRPSALDLHATHPRRRSGVTAHPGAATDGTLASKAIFWSIVEQRVKWLYLGSLISAAALAFFCAWLFFEPIPQDAAVTVVGCKDHVEALVFAYDHEGNLFRSRQKDKRLFNALVLTHSVPIHGPVFGTNQTSPLMSESEEFCQRNPLICSMVRATAPQGDGVYPLVVPKPTLEGMQCTRAIAVPPYFLHVWFLNGTVVPGTPIQVICPEHEETALNRMGPNALMRAVLSFCQEAMRQLIAFPKLVMDQVEEILAAEGVNQEWTDFVKTFNEAKTKLHNQAFKGQVCTGWKPAVSMLWEGVETITSTTWTVIKSTGKALSNVIRDSTLPLKEAKGNVRDQTDYVLKRSRRRAIILAQDLKRQAQQWVRQVDEQFKERDPEDKFRRHAKDQIRKTENMIRQQMEKIPMERILKNADRVASMAEDKVAKMIKSKQVKEARKKMERAFKDFKRSKTGKKVVKDFNLAQKELEALWEDFRDQVLAVDH